MNNDLLFPNTPVEVTEEGDGFHVWVEGRWHARFWKAVRVPESSGFVERSVAELVQHEVEDLVARLTDDWNSPVLRMAPEWSKWKDVNLFQMIQAGREAQRLKRGRSRRAKTNA